MQDSLNLEPIISLIPQCVSCGQNPAPRQNPAPTESLLNDPYFLGEFSLPVHSLLILPTKGAYVCVSVCDRAREREIPILQELD